MAKPRKAKVVTPPGCSHCGQPAHLVTGREVYPHRADLWDKPIWRCDPCQATVGCHPKGTTKPAGTPANRHLRYARMNLHNDMLDPIWRSAVETGGYKPENERAIFIIRAAARSRVYQFLAARMGIPIEACHVGAFTLNQCRVAWVELRGVAYPEIRAWCHGERVRTLLATDPGISEIRHACLDLCEGCRATWRLHDGKHDGGLVCAVPQLRETLAAKLASAPSEFA